jgi:hypothetical protein
MAVKQELVDLKLLLLKIEKLISLCIAVSQGTVGNISERTDLSNETTCN